MEHLIQAVEYLGNAVRGLLLTDIAILIMVGILWLKVFWPKPK
jgi:hypothetical protein